MNDITSFETVLEKNGSFLYTNVGRSMLPLLRQGRDLMYIERKGEGRCKKYDAVLYKSNGKYILHRILEVRDNDYVIAGDNNCFKEYGITDDDILGVMTAVIRDGKTISVDNKHYLRYVHLWCDNYPARVFVLKSIRAVRARLSKLKHFIIDSKEKSNEA